jgi:hypothetical protein
MNPIIDKLTQENSLPQPQFPWYLGLVVPNELTGNAIFYSDFVGYPQIDRNSLLRLLASGILAGTGPGSFYMKAHESGLAYAILMRANPARAQIGYYADRSLDLPSLVLAMNSRAAEISGMQDPYLVDYVLRQAFSIPRSIYTFAIRERVLAQEIRDGIAPERVRAFNQALLQLRQDPNLIAALTKLGKDSICGILLEDTCKAEQAKDHSIFFFVASEKTLFDLEKRIPIPKLIRIWPSDYWIE